MGKVLVFFWQLSHLREEEEKLSANSWGATKMLINVIMLPFKLLNNCLAISQASKSAETRLRRDRGRDSGRGRGRGSGRCLTWWLIVVKVQQVRRQFDAKSFAIKRVAKITHTPRVEGRQAAAVASPATRAAAEVAKFKAFDKRRAAVESMCHKLRTPAHTFPPGEPVKLPQNVLFSSFFWLCFADKRRQAPRPFAHTGSHLVAWLNWQL